MTESESPEPGLVHVEHNAKRPNAVVLNRRTVALTVFALMLGLFAVAAFVLDARGEAEAARAQSASNEQVIEEIQEQSERNGALVEQGVDCLIALQGAAARNSENANQASADFHGYMVPPLPDRVQIPTQVQQDFIETACTRFFQFQEAADGTAAPPAGP